MRQALGPVTATSAGGDSDSSRLGGLADDCHNWRILAHCGRTTVTERDATSAFARVRSPNISYD